MTKKKIARKIATYAMAASMIGGSILGSGITEYLLLKNIQLLRHLIVKL